MDEIINPYIAGAPVTEQRMFFGREDIFQWVENSIGGQYADHILVVHGQRRVGKTSVLKQLGNRLPKRYIPVFFDLQGRTHTTLDHFLWWLARETVRVLKQDREIEVPPPQKEAFKADPEYFENQFLSGLRSALGNNTLLLTFDEFDNLEESEVKEELARPLVDHLRRLMGQPNLNFIFSIGSSGRKLENMQAAYTDFFKTALYKKISFLNEEQTHHLVTRPVEGVLEYERAAVDRIYSVTSGHPYFTQLTCHELFARCQRTEQRRIAKADVEAILEDVVERGTVNLKFVWDTASDIEKWSLAALAQLDKTDNRAVADYLRKNRVRFSESDLTSGLLHLREKDVLTPQNRFVIHLLRIWLQKNRPIEQAREELTEANPIANHYIEIGLEFKHSHLYEKAIESFQEALSVSADNLQAQVNIALTYAAQGSLEQAVVEFEKALVLDDEDVTSRAGLCEAHLKLGDMAISKGLIQDAIQSYQRVLRVNAEHTEARQRMAEINLQRARKALTDGRDEEALNAFLEALKYTPEDPVLIEQLEKFKAEKKGKILTSLIASSEREEKALNWEAVVKTLEEANHLSPEDPNIQNKLAEARTKLHEKKLADLKMRARDFVKTERFDEALKAWQEYPSLNPEERGQVEVEMARIVKEQELFNLYSNAEQAITAGNFEEAVRLLKDVIIRNDNYKDVSRLLAKAIEARRKMPRQKKIKSRKETVQAPLPSLQSKTKMGNKKTWMIILSAILILGIGCAVVAVAVSEVVNLVNSRATEQAHNIQLTETSSLMNQQATGTKSAIWQQATATKLAYYQQATQAQRDNSIKATGTAMARTKYITDPFVATLHLVFDPRNRSLPHDKDIYYEENCTHELYRNFVAEAIFYNPYAASFHDWDYGFGFRQIGGSRYNITIKSDTTWHLVLWKAYKKLGDFSSGYLSNLRREEDNFNTIKFIAREDIGYLYVNDSLISSMDLSLLTAGDICVATGLYNASELPGYSTRYEDFSIWSISTSP